MRQSSCTAFERTNKMLEQRSCFLSECCCLDIMPPSQWHLRHIDRSTHTHKKKKKVISLGKKKSFILQPRGTQLRKVEACLQR
jgi:hypothetical protein